MLPTTQQPKTSLPCPSPDDQLQAVLVVDEARQTPTAQCRNDCMHAENGEPGTYHTLRTLDNNRTPLDA
jgi:hypothetical protein